MLAKSFEEDGLYQYMLPDQSSRRVAMTIYFECYLDVFGEYCDLITTSEELEAVGLIYYESRFKEDYKFFIKVIKGILKSFTMLKYISIKDLIRVFKTVHNTSSKWIYEQVEGDYIHIDLLAVKSDYRGQGMAKRIIENVLREGKQKGMVVTLETQNILNTEIYNHVGFTIVKEFSYKNLVQYCMVHK